MFQFLKLDNVEDHLRRRMRLKFDDMGTDHKEASVFSRQPRSASQACFIF